MKKIAVVEDNPDNRLLVRVILEPLYEVTEYETGFAGLEGLQRERPDLVLLDISLPEMDGPEVLRRIRADANLKDAPADPLCRRDRRFAPAIEHRTEHQIIDRRPARVGFGDAVLVELNPHKRPRHKASNATAPQRRCVAASSCASGLATPAAAAMVLAMKPPPSTRAWPSAAS